MFKFTKNDESATLKVERYGVTFLCHNCQQLGKENIQKIAEWIMHLAFKKNNREAIVRSKGRFEVLDDCLATFEIKAKVIAANHKHVVEYLKPSTIKLRAKIGETIQHERRFVVRLDDDGTAANKKQGGSNESNNPSQYKSYV
ncbi:MAG: hypothetical protein Q9159_004732 [Coniocarpon cinnabarinum]